jgi:hypothetical protein
MPVGMHLSCCVWYTVTLSGREHLTPCLIQRKLVSHAVLWTATISEGIFHAVLFTHLPFQSVSISHALLCTDTLWGGLYLMLCYVQTLYQEVWISCCVKYKVTIPVGMHLSWCVWYTVTLSGRKHLIPCLIQRRLVSHAVLWTATIIWRYLSSCVIYTVTIPVGQHLPCCIMHKVILSGGLYIMLWLVHSHHTRKYVMLRGMCSTPEVRVSHYTRF